jgi:nucleoside-diphosphate-sugar epimerase
MKNSVYSNIKPKISVFGASGFIGGRFCDMYTDSTLKIDRDDYVSKTNQILYFISTIDNYNVHSNLHIDIETNLSVLMNVLDKIDKNDKNLVFNFVSSWFVYGKNECMPFNEETSICNPTGFYSITKRCAEQLLISFCETFDIKYRIFRLANVLGEGDSKISKKKNAAQYLIKQIVNNEDVELYNGGTAIRDYIYVDDVCRAILHCMDNASVNEIINIGNGKPYKLIDIVEDTITQSNSVSNINKIIPPHFHKVVQVENSYLDISKLKSYGFDSETNMDEIINKLIKHYQKIMIDETVKNI